MSLFFRSKKADHDFEEDKLPSNRKEVFFDALKIRAGTLIRLGLVLLLFAAPLIVAGFIKDSYYYIVQTSYAQGEMTEENYSGIIFTIELFYYVAKIICFIVLGLGLSGVLRVIRQIIWGEPVFFWHDIFDGIKMQGARYSIYFFFAGLLNLLGRLVIFFGFNSEFLKYLPLGLNYVLFLPPLLYALIQSQIYRFRLLDEYKNGFILYFKTIPQTVLVTIIVCLPLLFDLISLLVLKYAVIAIYVVAVLPLLTMGEFLYFMSVLDRYINKERYPEIYDKGVRRK
ncbi:MAG: hypothetical protein J5762_02045 [Clostridia bacterium]|nr:hypothetical protein [Clostridia bacterium]